LIISPVNTQYKHNYTYLTQILDMYIIRYVAIYTHTHIHTLLDYVTNAK